MFKYRLPFGAPIEQVCHEGILHPRLKELFVLALTSVVDDASVIGRHHAVLSALRVGPRGQGSLSTRLALKNVLESGKSFESFLRSSSSLPLSETETVPPGAALWLLRVFFGRLPLPLLIGTRWRQLGKQCSVASRRTCSTSTFGSTSNIQLMNTAAKCLQNSSLAERTLLKALLQFMSKLGGGGPALLALADFYAPSLVGATTVRFADQVLHDVRSLLLFLCCHWEEIFRIFGDDNQNCPLFCEDATFENGSQPGSLEGRSSRSLRSFMRSRTEFRAKRASSVTLGSKSVSWTDTRQKLPLTRWMFKQIYEAKEKGSATSVTSSVMSVASVAAGTGRTPPDQTPLLRSSDVEVEESRAFKPVLLDKISRENPEESSVLACKRSSTKVASSKEKSESRCWLKAFFGSRRASMSSIPSATEVKYEPISDKKKTWTL